MQWGLFILSLIILSSCDKQEEFNIENFDPKIGVEFTANNERVFIGNEVSFTNNSIGEGELQYKWTFEGGEPETSTDKNPAVLYAKEGNFSVTLEVIGLEATNQIVKESYITVFSDAGWGNFSAPNINFKNKALNGSGAIYAALITDEQKLIKNTCLEVCATLFKSWEEVNVLDNIDYTVEDTDGISAKGGSQPNISIFFSSRYLAQKKAEGLNDQELKDEVVGVLVHEITHGYQYEPKGAGEYKQGDDFYGFIEGMADIVRYLRGYTPVSKRSAGGHWNDGYNTSAFFMDWLHSKDIEFLYKFNQSAEKINPWSWEAATQSILKQSVQELWNEYQNDIQSGKIIEIDAKLKELRSGNVDPTPIDPDAEKEVIDITNDGCTITRGAGDVPDGEPESNLIDNDFGSKFLIFESSTWVQLDFTKSAIVKSYSLTSGNDAPGRDPKNWKLLGSNDGSTWTEIDNKSNQSFAQRNETLIFVIENTSSYNSYKFEFSNTEGDIFQLSEIELFNGVSSIEEPTPSKDPVDIIQKRIAFDVKPEEGDFFDWGMPEAAFDGAAGTSFFNLANDTWYVFETAEKYNVTKLSISATKNLFDIEYVFSPDQATILGSNDGENWTEITSISETGIVAFEEKKEFEFENTKFYKFHKLTLLAEIEEKGRIMIGEIELFGTPE